MATTKALRSVWKSLHNEAPFSVSMMLLLTDGTVMAQETGGARWTRLTPDGRGSYIHGTWSTMPPMRDTRTYYASAVLRDGRVLVCGGEESSAGRLTNRCEIYDPLLGWDDVAPPDGWDLIGDAPCAVLPDGRFFLGEIGDMRTAAGGTRTVVWDPSTGLWSAAAETSSRSGEETWTLLGDGTVMAPKCSGHPATAKYDIAKNEWIAAGNTPVDLVDPLLLEIGPACLLPDGRLFAAGATGHTALYTPPSDPAEAGLWTAGPDFPLDAAGMTVGCRDAPACLLPNGNVLCAAGPIDGSDKFFTPTYMHEFDGTNLIRVDDPPTATKEPFRGRMLIVPTGEVLFTAEATRVCAYGPARAPLPAWRPVVLSVPAKLHSDGTYTLFGRQLNGLSQAVSYGDDAAAATNYPLIRLRRVDDQTIHYCRTFNHSSMGVATGSAVISTQFHVPEGIRLGDFELSVVVNGIASAAVPVSVRLRPTYVVPFPLEKFVRIVVSGLRRLFFQRPRR